VQLGIKTRGQRSGSTQIYHDRLNKLIVEFHEQILAADAAYEQAREAAGIIMLDQRATKLLHRGESHSGQDWSNPTNDTWEVIALIDFWRDREFQGWPEQAFASLREIAAREPHW
jgi:hypothetical protein